jgi:hypothetical protein
MNYKESNVGGLGAIYKKHYRQEDCYAVIFHPMCLSTCEIVGNKSNKIRASVFPSMSPLP